MTEEEIETGTWKKRISIDFGRQGGIFLGYTIIILGFYGIVANTITYDWHYEEWIPFLDIDRTLLIWPYLSWPYNFFIPFTLLFGVCFLLWLSWLITNFLKMMKNEKNNFYFINNSCSNLRL